jgi:hypothetical protein
VALAWVVGAEPANSSRADDLLPRWNTLAAAPPGAERIADSTLPSPTPLLERPAAYALPPPGWPAVEFQQLDPLLDRAYSAQPGLFANVETNVLWLHLHNRLSAPVPNPLTGAADQVELGRTSLDATAAPRFEVGYRLPDNWGTCSLGYGFLASQGHEVTATGPANVVQGFADKQGRLVYNMWDLTYGSREYCLDPFCNMRWGVGTRLLSLFFDTRGAILNPGSDVGSVLAQSATNYVQCYGFWAYLDVERHIGPPGLAAFFHLEGADFFARVHQNYTETVVGAPGQGPQTAAASFTGSVGPTNLREIVGLSYTVPQWNSSRFLIGYQYEQFFQIGRLSTVALVPDTRGSLDAHGLFLRAEFNF